MAKMPDAVDGKVTLEWLVRGQVALFRSHLEPFVRPAPINGACVVHVYSPTSCEIKGMVAGNMGKDMIRGYRTVVRMLANEGYTGVMLEVFDQEGTPHAWLDGKRQIAQKPGDSEALQSF